MLPPVSPKSPKLFLHSYTPPHTPTLPSYYSPLSTNMTSCAIQSPKKMPTTQGAATSWRRKAPYDFRTALSNLLVLYRCYDHLGLAPE